MKTIAKIMVFMFLLCGTLRAAMNPLVYIETDSNGVSRISTQNQDLVKLNNKEINLLTSEDLAALRKQFFIELQALDYSTRALGAGCLLALGDYESITLVLKAYHMDNYAAESSLRGAANAGNVTLLPYLIDDIYNGPTEWQDHGDVSVAPIRDRSTEMALASIIRSSLFPPETRAWADQAIDGFRYFAHDQALTQFKDWWAHNKEAILAKQYDKATWLPPKIAPTSAANAQLPSAPKPPPTPPPQPAANSPLKWLLSAAVIVVALGLGFHFLRRK